MNGAATWITRCADQLIHAHHGGPLDGTDWDDIAEDLHGTLSALPPEFAALAFTHLVHAVADQG